MDNTCKLPIPYNYILVIIYMQISCEWDKESQEFSFWFFIIYNIHLND